MKDVYTIGVIILILLIIIGIFMLYEGGILRRKVTVTIIENLPPWIFKQGKKEEYSKNCELKTSTETSDEIIHEDVEKVDDYAEVSCDKDESKCEENSDFTEEMPIEEVIKEDETSCLNEENQEHKAKFITNSLSMLKDYEKLMDKLNNNDTDKIIEDEISGEKEEAACEELKNTEEVKEAVNGSSEMNDSNEENCEEIVYWTTSGKTYHMTKECRTLARSKVIHSGTIAESCKNSACSRCKK